MIINWFGLMNLIMTANRIQPIGISKKDLLVTKNSNGIRKTMLIVKMENLSSKRGVRQRRIKITIPAAITGE
jgi:hypothetical protein